MPKFLEVIVTSLAEAREAEAGGADRLELVRAFEVGGLTPDLKLVEEVVRSVSIPVRVMLRDSTSMEAGPNEIQHLRLIARELNEMPIDGVVAGFAKDDQLDLEAIGAVLEAAERLPATMHRAFEHAGDSISAIRELKRFGQIDRILTSGGTGDWEQRRRNLLEWQAIAAPEMKILIGVGLRTSVLTEISQVSKGFEFHVGRAARVPAATNGLLKREQIAHLKALP